VEEEGMGGWWRRELALCSEAWWRNETLEVAEYNL
jgi:hypothetical protein